MTNIKLGSKVRDKVTGFTGIATAKIEYLNGCIQICIKPPVGENNIMPDVEYVDIDQIEILEEEKITFLKKLTGGPQRDCPKH